MTSLKGGTPRAADLTVTFGGQRYFVATPEQASQAGGRAWTADTITAQGAEGAQEFEVPLSDWSQGAGFSFEGLPGTYDRASGWDFTTPGKGSTWPERATGEAITTVDYRGWQFQLGNYLYVARGRFVAKYEIDDTAGAEWPVVEVHDLGSGIVVAGRPGIFKGKAYIPRRSGAGGSLAIFHELTDQATHVTETQTIAISGTPTAGTYTVTFDGKTTAAIAYNADGATVQAALRLVAGLERVTVVTTGTTPNFTHTVTMTAVGGALGASSAPQMTSTDSTTGGSHAIAHATTTAGTTDTWTAGPADRESRCFRTWQNKLVLAEGNFIRSVSGDPMTAGDWTPTTTVGYEIGESGQEITDLATHGKLLMVGKTDGLWSFDESLNTINEVPDLQTVVDGSNCIGMESFGGFLLVPHKTGLIRWAPGVYSYVGPEQEGALEGGLSHGWGRVAGVAPYGRYGFLVSNDSRDTCGAVVSLQPALPGRAGRQPLVPHVHHEHESAQLESAVIIQTAVEPASPHDIGTAANDSAVGANDWSSPGNAIGDNGFIATVASTGVTHYLKGTALGFDIPDGATVQGVLAEVKRRVKPAAPAYVAAAINGSGSGTGTSVTVSKPTGTSNGHLILVAIQRWGNSTITPPAGWTLFWASAAEISAQFAVYYKVASSEGSSWTWTLASAEAWTVAAVTYSGVDQSTPIDTAKSHATMVVSGGSRWWGAGYSAAQDNARVVSLAGTSNTASNRGISGAPSDFTARASNGAGGSATQVEVWVADKGPLAAGASGLEQWPGEADSAGWAAAIANIVLNGASAATDTTVKLVKAGTVSGNDLALDTTLPTTLAYQAFGGALEMWGLALTPADVNASGFGVAYSATFTSGAQVEVDAIRVTVYYSVPGVSDSPSFLSVLKLNAARTDANPVIYTLPRAGMTVANDPNLDKARDAATAYSSRILQPSRNVQKTYRVVDFWLDAAPETNTPGFEVWASVDDAAAIQLLDAAGAAATFRTTGFHQAYFPTTAAAVGSYVQVRPTVPAKEGAEVDVAVSFRDMVLRGSFDPLITEAVDVTLVLGAGEHDDRSPERRTTKQQRANLKALAAPNAAPVPYTDPWGNEGFVKVANVRFREVTFKAAEESTLVAFVALRVTA